MLKINDVAKLAGVTVRTLHYYDEIGLLTPSEVTESGYRLYDEKDLARLQQILFFRELDFPLNQIKEIMKNETYNANEALETHKKLLNQKRERLDRLIMLVEKTLKGEKSMSFKEFDMTEIEKIKQKYADEVKERWGDTSAYAESEKKTGTYNKEQWQMIDEETSNIFKAFAQSMDKAPSHPEVQALVNRWQAFISERFYHCTKEILQGLGLMYVGDERFKNNIDQYGDGLAEFINEAIQVYTAQ